MSYDNREKSVYGGQPYELFWFQTADQNWRITGADEPKSYGGQVFTPEAITHDEPTQGAELKSGGLKVHIPLDHEIAGLFISYIPTSPLWLTIYRAHDGEAESETIVHWTGKVSNATLGDDCELACVPEYDALKKRIPNAKFQPQCNRILFDAGCGVSRAAFRVAATLTSVVGPVLKSAAFAAKANGWFNNGYVEKGNARRMVLTHAGDTVTLIAGMPGLITGDHVNVYAGCNRSSAQCTSKFSNAPNFFGFAWVPTKNPFKSLT